MSVGLVALLTGIALLASLAWVWGPSRRRRPEPPRHQPVVRREVWTWPPTVRAGSPPTNRSVVFDDVSKELEAEGYERIGKYEWKRTKLPPTWAEYRKEQE